MNIVLFIVIDGGVVKLVVLTEDELLAKQGAPFENALIPTCSQGTELFFGLQPHEARPARAIGTLNLGSGLWVG